MNELSHSLVKDWWNHTIYRDLRKHGACKRWVLKNGDIVFFRNLADFQCDKVLALGHDNRCVAFFANITQRHRKVCGVGDDKRCARHIVDHAAAGTVAGDGTLAGFDHRVACDCLYSSFTSCFVIFNWLNQ
ncbi:hypothetical protein Ddc_21505 [Ditylenchus destructor]|nr:hypothetical protein Ddc_21505 [Ditylenchus destructor]